jgi:hypothetical protein
MKRNTVQEPAGPFKKENETVRLLFGYERCSAVRDHLHHPLPSPWLSVIQLLVHLDFSFL